MVCTADSPLVLSLVPGRMRLHLPEWTGEDVEWIEDHLLPIRGVRSVHANQLTGNILIHFDRSTTDEKSLRAALGEAWGELLASQRQSNDERSADAGRSSLRIVVRGLLGHAVVDSLWFGAGILGSAMGLPLAGLGPLHVLMDIAVWTMAVAGEGGAVSIAKDKRFLVLAGREEQRILS